MRHEALAEKLEAFDAKATADKEMFELQQCAFQLYSAWHDAVETAATNGWRPPLSLSGEGPHLRDPRDFSSCFGHDEGEVRLDGK